MDKDMVRLYLIKLRNDALFGKDLALDTNDSDIFCEIIDFINVKLAKLNNK